MKRYISKWITTSGEIMEREMDVESDGTAKVSGESSYYRYRKGEHFETVDQAQLDAFKRIDRKSKSLNAQLEKLSKYRRKVGVPEVNR